MQGGWEVDKRLPANREMHTFHSAIIIENSIRKRTARNKHSEASDNRAQLGIIDRVREQRRQGELYRVPPRHSRKSPIRRSIRHASHPNRNPLRPLPRHHRRRPIRHPLLRFTTTHQSRPSSHVPTQPRDSNQAGPRYRRRRRRVHGQRRERLESRTRRRRGQLNPVLHGLRRTEENGWETQLETIEEASQCPTAIDGYSPCYL